MIKHSVKTSLEATESRMNMTCAKMEQKFRSDLNSQAEQIK